MSKEDTICPYDFGPLVFPSQSIRAAPAQHCCRLALRVEVPPGGEVVVVGGPHGEDGVLLGPPGACAELGGVEEPQAAALLAELGAEEAVDQDVDGGVHHWKGNREGGNEKNVSLILFLPKFVYAAPRNEN